MTRTTMVDVWSRIEIHQIGWLVIRPYTILQLSHQNRDHSPTSLNDEPRKLQATNTSASTCVHGRNTSRRNSLSNYFIRIRPLNRWANPLSFLICWGNLVSYIPPGCRRRSDKQATFLTRSHKRTKFISLIIIITRTLRMVYLCDIMIMTSLLHNFKYLTCSTPQQARELLE